MNVGVDELHKGSRVEVKKGNCFEPRTAPTVEPEGAGTMNYQLLITSE